MEQGVALYRIAPPEGQTAEDFVAFMRSEVIPAVHTGLTRVGSVAVQTLLRDEPGINDGSETDVEFPYLLVVDWDGLRFFDRQVADAIDKLHAAGARTKLQILVDV